MGKTEEKKRKVAVTFCPGEKRILASIGTNLREVIIKTAIGMNFPCGGKGVCGKCKVKITKGMVSPPTSLEKKHLSSLGKGVRLACQTVIKGDVRLDFYPLSLTSFPQILIKGVSDKIKIKPDIKKIYLSLPLPQLKDQIDDVSRIKRELRKKGIYGVSIELALIRELVGVIREGNFKVTTILASKKILGVEKGDTRGRNFGVAFDIGTTTVVGILLDLDTGEEIATDALLNPQVSFGDDVVSRVNFIQSHQGGLRILQKEIIGAINEIIEKLRRKGKVKRANIYKATFVGNTVMQHFLLGINPLNLALYPYVPVVCDSVKIKALSLGIRINPYGQVYVFPNIAAFIGGDTVGVILATFLFEKKNRKIRLVIDIGTNGEIVLSKEDRLLCASTAAGPAFEGARISQGMRAEKGAIEKVKFKRGKVEISVIRGGRARGICGSGLIDASNELLKEGIIDSSGYIRSAGNKKDIWKDRIIKQGKNNSFVLSEKEESEGGIPVIITQRDIRELQLAKAAIYAGINILLEKLAVKRDEVDEVLLAGAFGSYINPDNAYLIGLIPFFPKAKIFSVGNAAGLGAVMALMSSKIIEKVEKIPRIVEYIELAASPCFQDKLVEGMGFGKN